MVDAYGAELGTAFFGDLPHDDRRPLISAPRRPSGLLAPSERLQLRVFFVSFFSGFSTRRNVCCASYVRRFSSISTEHWLIRRRASSAAAA
jgi:hypothetical protein